MNATQEKKFLEFAVVVVTLEEAVRAGLEVAAISLKAADEGGGPGGRSGTGSLMPTLAAPPSHCQVCFRRLRGVLVVLANRQRKIVGREMRE